MLICLCTDKTERYTIKARVNTVQIHEYTI